MTDNTQQPYVVSSSQVLAAVRTIGSLVVFATGFFATVVKLLSAHDLAGLYNYLQSDSVVAGLAMVATTGWLVWRTVAAWYKKRRDVEIAHAAPDSVAIVK